MRYAVISDIHANLEALEAVLSAIERLAIDRIVFLGDAVGYHANPHECLALLRARTVLGVAGNHDQAATGAKQPTSFGERGRRAILWTREQLRSDECRYLDSLPVFLQSDDFALVHAALHPEPNVDLHLSTRARVERSLERLLLGVGGVRLVFFGHTHRPAAYEVAPGARASGHRALRPERLRLSPDAFYLINPGSVGQSRDGDERAMFLVFDDAAREIVFYRVAYDRARCLQKAGAAGLLRSEPLLHKASNWLGDRFASGRYYTGRVWQKVSSLSGLPTRAAPRSRAPAR